MRPIILVGGGGHCMSVIEAAESAGYKILGILDKPELVGKSILNYHIIGTDNDIPKYTDKADFIITVGSIKDTTIRMRISKLIKAANGILGTVIASTANVSKYATIGKGTVVLHHASVNAGAKVGMNVIINTGANIEHCVEVGDFTHVSTGAMVNGDCHIGRRCFIGSNSVIKNEIHLCDDVVIGCGTVVVKDIDNKGTYIGNPAMNINKIINKTSWGGVVDKTCFSLAA